MKTNIIFFCTVFCIWTCSRNVISESDSTMSLTKYKHAVKVFHYILNHWGATKIGTVPCGDIYCEWVGSDHIQHLRNNYLYTTDHNIHGLPLLTVSVYNAHTLWEKYRDTHPLTCELPTNLTFAESEECFIRYGPLLEQSSKHFDGISTTHPKTTVQRIYTEALINITDFLPKNNYSSLIKGGSYIASDCHRRDSANANRDGIVKQIRDAGYRVDGLGRCMSSGEIPEGISLPRTRDTRYNLHLKRQVISKYLFNMAFENSIELGYVTEKPFDALLAGTVPVYLGDCNQLKYLLPDPKAAICVSDFQNITHLAEYLSYLSKNETAYEEHRHWRNTFSYEKNIAGKYLMEIPWHCRICEWAINTTSNHHLHQHPQHRAIRKPCLPHKDTIATSSSSTTSTPVNNHNSIVKQKLPQEFENLALRAKNSRQVYLVYHGILHAFPDLATFIARNMTLDKVHVVEPEEMERMIVGESLPTVVEQ